MSQDLMIIGILLLLGSMQPALAGNHGMHEDMPRSQAEMRQEKSGAHASREDVQERSDMNMHDSEWMDMSKENPDMGNMKGAFLKKKTVDGYQLSFHVMKATGDADYGGAYEFMFKVEQNGKALRNLMVNSKVSHPNHQSESKMMTNVGDWYTAGYDLTHPGKHELIVLFKTKDGSKHSAGVSYPVKQRE